MGRLEELLSSEPLSSQPITVMAHNDITESAAMTAVNPRVRDASRTVPTRKCTHLSFRGCDEPGLRGRREA